MSIETFLEKNYIDPKIKKFTDAHLKTEILKKDFKCGKCHKPFYYDDLTPINYPENKRVLFCKTCLKNRKVKR